jgi:hypothetical protein
MTTNEAIALALRDFAKEFVANRKSDVLKRNLRNTDGLLESLYAKVNADPKRGIFLMNAFANTYGRYHDMRRLYSNVGGPEMLAALKMWADKEGLGNFNKGKYSAKNAGLPPEQIREAIAWGTIRKLRTQPGTRKRSWWNKGKTRDIEVFYDHLLRVYQEAIAAELKTAA